MAQLTISDAARRCGVARRTLQWAIRAGRLPLTPDHHVTIEALVQAGYAPATVTHQPTAATPQRQRDTSQALSQDMSQGVSQLLSSMGERLDRIIVLLESLCHSLVLRQTAATPQHPPVTPQAPQGTPQTPPSRGDVRRRIVVLLREHQEGLSPLQTRRLLGISKDLANTMHAMARYGLLRRVERGRYVGA